MAWLAVSFDMQALETAVTSMFGVPLPKARDQGRTRHRPPKATMQEKYQEQLASRTAEDLILLIARQRDRDAFRELFVFYAPRIRTMLMKGGVTAEQAEDLAQETLVSVWHKAQSYDPQRAPASAWIFTITRNLKIDRFRRDRRAKLHQLYELTEPDETPSPEQPLEHAETERQIHDALGHLPADQIDVVRLSFFEGRPHGDIAVALGIPLGTVKSRLRLALKRLRDLLGEQQ